MEKNFAVKTKKLTKCFETNEIIKGCDMEVEIGSIYGLLGANGVGKTTIFKLLTGLLSPTAGSVEVLGADIQSNRNTVLHQIGSLIETPVFYEHLSAEQNLEIHLAYMDTAGIGIRTVLDMVGLGKTGEKPVSKYSLGMRQRLAIARAIIHQPKLLILDEPMNGLDPMGIREIRELFLELVKKQNMTILLSSHILSEVEHVADVVGVIVSGKLAREVRLEQLNIQGYDSLEDYFFEIMKGGSNYD